MNIIRYHMELMNVIIFFHQQDEYQPPCFPIDLPKFTDKVNFGAEMKAKHFFVKVSTCILIYILKTALNLMRNRIHKKINYLLSLIFMGTSLLFY